MIDQDGKTVEANEITFFATYYEHEAYNPHGWRLRLERELSSLKRVIGPQPLKRVLSVGCGDGAFELRLAALAEHITALDISAQAIQLAKHQALQMNVTHIDFQCLPLAELDWAEQFDAIICLAFLHHLPEQDLLDFLKQVHEHLKPSGFFYSQDPSVHGVLRKLGRVILGANYDKYHTPDERELDPAELTRLLKLAGFASVNVGYIDFTLIPALYILAKGPAWPLYLCVGLDWLWCHSPFARWASGFTAVAKK